MPKERLLPIPVLDGGQKTESNLTSEVGDRKIEFITYPDSLVIYDNQRVFAISNKQPEKSVHISRRYLNYLNLVSLGYTNNEIAQRYGLSEQTIKHQLSIIYEKMKVDNRLEAVRRCFQLKLIDVHASAKDSDEKIITALGDQQEEDNTL